MIAYCEPVSFSSQRNAPVRFCLVVMRWNTFTYRFCLMYHSALYGIRHMALLCWHAQAHLGNRQIYLNPVSLGAHLLLIGQ